MNKSKLMSIFYKAKKFTLVRSKLLFIFLALFIYAAIYWQAHSLYNKPVVNSDAIQNITINKSTVDRLKTLNSN